MSNNEVNALRYELLMRDIVAAAEKLPPFPDVAWKLTALIKRTAPVKEMEEVIACDQSLAARILRTSQAAHFARRYDVRSLKDAILILGNKRLIQLILSSCAMRYFERGGAGREDRELWQHSVATAIMSEIISRRLNNRKVLTIYTAALLHDIGKTILNVYARIYLHSTLRRIRADGHFVRAERSALGIDHQELGGMIARNWRFPSEIVAAIEHHHDPERAGRHREVAAMVYLSNELAGVAASGGAGAGKHGFDPQKDPVFRSFGFTTKMIEEVHEELTGRLGGVKRMLEG